MFPTALTVGPLLALLPTESIQIQDAPNGAWRTVTGAFVDRQTTGGAARRATRATGPCLSRDSNDPIEGVAGGFDKGRTTFCVAQRIGGTADPAVPRT